MAPDPIVVVERQLRAYNAHDLDEFVSCFTTDVVVLDPGGDILAAGRDQLRDRYAERFRTCPELHAEIEYRRVNLPYVTDIERISGWGADVVVATVIYRLADSAIDRVVIAATH